MAVLGARSRAVTLLGARNDIHRRREVHARAGRREGCRLSRCTAVANGRSQERHAATIVPAANPADASAAWNVMRRWLAYRAGRPRRAGLLQSASA